MRFRNFGNVSWADERKARIAEANKRYAAMSPAARAGERLSVGEVIDMVACPFGACQRPAGETCRSYSPRLDAAMAELGETFVHDIRREAAGRALLESGAATIPESALEKHLRLRGHGDQREAA